MTSGQSSGHGWLSGTSMASTGRAVREALGAGVSLRDRADAGTSAGSDRSRNGSSGTSTGDDGLAASLHGSSATSGARLKRLRGRSAEGCAVAWSPSQKRSLWSSEMKLFKHLLGSDGSDLSVANVMLSSATWASLLTRLDGPDLSGWSPWSPCQTFSFSSTMFRSRRRGLES